MSEDQASPVFMLDNADPQMQQAYEQARATFRYFWREVAWDRRRIVPALELAIVKAPFTDGAAATEDGDTPHVEHMWMSDVDFDGQFVGGVLGNDPNWLQSVKAGDVVRVPVAEISDWMYVLGGEAYGGHTVNLMRSRMSPAERQEHDDAWGLSFGDPLHIRTGAEKEPHPMSESMASSLAGHAAKDPSLISAKGHNGWTVLHAEAAAGSVATAQALLDAGADPNALADNGMTPLQLAQSLGWEPMVQLLAGAKAAPPAPPRTAPAPPPTAPAPAAANGADGAGPPAQKRPWWRFWG